MNKVFNNDNARRYVHMALSRQIKSMEAAGMSQEEIQALIDSAIAEYDAQQLEEAINNDYSVLDYGEETYAYGVLIDFTEGKSSPDLKRIGNMELHRTLPVQSQYKGCIWDYGSQKILYYLNPENWNLAVNDTVNNVQKTATEVKADMENAEYGMRVETPKFYATSKVLATDGAGHTTMAKVMFSTIKLNAHYIEIPRQVTDFRNVRYGDDIFENDGLFCNMNTTHMHGGYGGTVDTISGHTQEYLYPITNVTRGWARDIASHNNTHLMCYEYYKWLFYWAFVIEYATLNSHKPINNELDEDGFHQGGLGGGLTNFIENNGITLNMLADNANIAKDKCRYIGVTNSLGNGTGELSIRTDTDNSKIGHPNRYRGFECPFGDIRIILDGFLGVNVDDIDYFWTCANPQSFGDTVPSFYEEDTSMDWRIAGIIQKKGNANGGWSYPDYFGGYDERGKMMYANIGNEGDLFPQGTIQMEDISDDVYFVNQFYPIDEDNNNTPKILRAGSTAGTDGSPSVGLGYFDAALALSYADYFLGFRCFNIIKDDGTII